MKNTMNKINVAALENVTGGTDAENIEIMQALGLERNMCMITLTQMLFYDCRVYGHLHSQNSPNEYLDVETHAPLTQTEVIERIKKR